MQQESRHQFRNPDYTVWLYTNPGHLGLDLCTLAKSISLQNERHCDCLIARHDCIVGMKLATENYPAVS